MSRGVDRAEELIILRLFLLRNEPMRTGRLGRLDRRGGVARARGPGERTLGSGNGTASVACQLPRNGRGLNRCLPAGRSLATPGSSFIEPGRQGGGEPRHGARLDAGQKMHGNDEVGLVQGAPLVSIGKHPDLSESLIGKPGFLKDALGSRSCEESILRA